LNFYFLSIENILEYLVYIEKIAILAENKISFFEKVFNKLKIVKK